jgi:8-oxo-dGTP diphosphatase
VDTVCACGVQGGEESVILKGRAFRGQFGSAAHAGTLMAVGQFLAMVGVLVWRQTDGKYLLLQRSAAKDFAAGEWECVTGRLEQGESFVQAVRREAFEELGLDVHVEFILGTTHFYRGDALPENEIVGVYYGCSIPGATSMRLSDEHCAYQWVTAEQAQALFPAGHWLRVLIARAEVVRGLIPQTLLQFYRHEGFEP